MEKVFENNSQTQSGRLLQQPIREEKQEKI